MFGIKWAERFVSETYAVTSAGLIGKGNRHSRISHNPLVHPDPPLSHYSLTILHKRCFPFLPTIVILRRKLETVVIQFYFIFFGEGGEVGVGGNAKEVDWGAMRGSSLSIIILCIGIYWVIVYFTGEWVVSLE